MVQPRSAATSVVMRSARAEIVRSGLTPRGRGTIAPSQTYRPSCTASPAVPAKTRPRSSTTPVSAVSAIGHPPSGCTVTTSLRSALTQTGLCR